MSEHDTLAAALVAALADLTVVEKGRTAKIPTKDGKSYSYDYADIADVVSLTRPALAKHGLVALTPVHDHGDGLACTVTILHAGSGERLDLGPFPFQPGRDAQSTGSAVTYHRRYALVAALGMAAGEDDDGQHASESTRQPKQQEMFDEKTAYNRLIAVLEERNVPEHVDVARAVWLKAKPNLVDGEVTDDEWQRVLAVSNELAGAPA